MKQTFFPVFQHFNLNELDWKLMFVSQLVSLNTSGFQIFFHMSEWFFDMIQTSEKCVGENNSGPRTEPCRTPSDSP